MVFSDQTLGNLQAADPVTAAQIGDASNHWDDIDVHFRGRTVRYGEHGFCGIGRKRLLNILQQRCLDLGVELTFEQDVTDDQALAAEFAADLVIASDGLNSRIRTRYADSYQPDIDLRECRFVWLGTRQTFAAFTFAVEQTEHGWFQAHAYQYDDTTSTFIVETPEAVWKAHALDAMEQVDAIAFCEKLFAKYLDGHALMRNDQTDQDSLPEYPILDEIMSLYMEHNLSAADIKLRGLPAADVDKVVRLLRINEYKRRQAPVGPRVTPRAYGRDWRYPITSGWRE